MSPDMLASTIVIGGCISPLTWLATALIIFHKSYLGVAWMPHGAYCVVFKHNRWTVSQFGRDLGSFYFRAKALKFAVESACWSAAANCPQVFILDRTGDFYTAWHGTRDALSADIR